MGRKIPGKKCKRVKDPEKQRAARLENLKDKINLDPAFPDEQEIPHNLKHLIYLKEKAKGNQLKHVKKRRKNKELINGNRLFGEEVDLPGMTKPVRPVPNFNQRKGEAEHHFLHRIERLCQNVVNESKFEKKFGVEVCRNSETGAIEVKKCSDLERGKKKKKSSSSNEKNNINRAKYKKAVKQLSKLERRESDFGHLNDEVKFGEVVHQPPSLKVLPRKASANSSERKPGQKDLILKRLLNPSTSVTTAAPRKWKDMSDGDKMRMEQRREEAVKAYKMLKAQRYSQAKSI